MKFFHMKIFAVCSILLLGIFVFTAYSSASISRTNTENNLISGTINTKVLEKNDPLFEKIFIQYIENRLKKRKFNITRIKIKGNKKLPKGIFTFKIQEVRQ